MHKKVSISSENFADLIVSLLFHKMNNKKVLMSENKEFNEFINEIEPILKPYLMRYFLKNASSKARKKTKILLHSLIGLNNTTTITVTPSKVLSKDEVENKSKSGGLLSVFLKRIIKNK